MFRWGAIIAGVFAVGLAAGVLLSAVQASDAPEKSSVAPPPDTTELNRLRAELKKLEEDRAILAARNEALESDAATARSDQALMDDLLQDASAPEAAPEPGEAAPPTPPPGSNPERDWRRGRPQPTPEQMAEFRKNYEKQQERMRQRTDEQLTQMNDPNAINNFNALLDLQTQEQDLRRQLRDAKTDDAKNKLEAELRETRQSARDLLTAQQDAIFQNLAASSGIKSADAQQKFVEDVRATLNNPFFRMEPMLGGGGRGGPRGGGFPGPRGAGPN